MGISIGQVSFPDRIQALAFCSSEQCVSQQAAATVLKLFKSNLKVTYQSLKVTLVNVVIKTVLGLVWLT